MTYNIPIAIWLELDHPFKCPLVFVTPTQNMCLQQTPFVDQKGKVNLPFLEEWSYVRVYMYVHEHVILHLLCV